MRKLCVCYTCIYVAGLGYLLFSASLRAIALVFTEDSLSVRQSGIGSVVASAT